VVEEFIKARTLNEQSFLELDRFISKLVQNKFRNQQENQEPLSERKN
jgi:hypothetical protein